MRKSATADLRGPSRRARSTIAAILRGPASPGTSGRGRSLRLRPDGHRDLADAFDFSFQLIAGLQRGNAGGRAGHDDIAGGKLDHLGQLPDDLRHIPDHLFKIAVLLHFAVDLEPDAALARVADLGRRLQRAAGRGAVERLADLPRPL